MTAPKPSGDWPDPPKVKNARDQAAINSYHEHMTIAMQRKLDDMSQNIPTTSQKQG